MNKQNFFILKYIIGLMFLVSSFYAQADAQTLERSKAEVVDVLSDFGSFSLWIKDRVSFECQSNPSAANFMESQIPRILYIGLRAIKKINSEFISQKIKENSGRDILFSCVPEDKSRSWGALYDPTPIYLSLDSFRFSMDGNIILLPMNIISSIANNLPNLDNDFLMADQLDNSLMSWFQNAFLDQSLYSKNAIVHEFLHFLRIDNFSHNYHNSLGSKETHIGFDEDMIYACADLSFPIWSVYMRHTAVINGLIKGFDLGKACLNCAMAAEVKGRVRLDQNKFKTASESCKFYRDIKY